VDHPRFLTEPRALVAFLIPIFLSLKPGNDFDVLFGAEAPEGEFAVDKHGQSWRLHTTDGKIFTINQSVGAGEIHADKPIGAASTVSRVRQPVVLAAWT
jgi:hypothetical protein